jgi:formamidopyrimidine-DNA glycosylase
LPELPEVETIRRGLDAAARGRRIDAVWTSDVPLRKTSPRPLADAEGRHVKGLRRHAKVLFWDLDDGQTIVSHLGMTGRFRIHAARADRAPHTHAVLALSDGHELHFSDPRRFGWMTLHAAGDAPRDADHYGLDALDARFTAPVLERMLRASRAPLKAFLIDQTKVAGLGNIYACEALWRAGLSPRRLARNTPTGKVQALHDAIAGVLADSLAAGGTSFNDYVDAIGREGSFLFDVTVFQRAGRPCLRCGPDATVRRIVQGGRSTFYCPRCQH